MDPLIAQEQQPLIGESLAHYRILEKIGAGGMGEIYLARDTKLGRKVAIKLLPAFFTHHTDRLRRFQQEASSASALNHPNIVTIFEIGVDNGRHFMATEFIEGETLRERMKGSAVNLQEALAIAAQVGAALEAAHEVGIVHRDIKPENIMIRRRDAIVKVLDFGLAKLAEKSADKQVSDSEVRTRALVRTEAGVVMGTTCYMSPEQARGLAVDERTDIWSLGVVIYETVVGGLPFSGDTAEDVRASILKDDLPLSNEVPEPLRAFLERALCKNKEARYQTMAELLAELHNLQSGVLDSPSSQQQASGAVSSNRSTEATKDAQNAKAEFGSAARTDDLSQTRVTSSAEYLLTELRRHKVQVTLVISIAIVALTAAFYFTSKSRTADKAVTSVAVLPFVNAGGNPNSDYLSDGITESIINSLAQLPQLKVLARTTVFHYKGREADPQKAGKELGVDELLTGRVLQQGDTLIIQADLVRVADGSEIWGERYNRKLSDIFAVQDEIAKHISEKLKPRLSGDEQKQVTKRYTDNVEAYQLYLRGLFEWNKFTPEGLAKSIEYCNQAIAIDPTYALAYAGLSEAYGLQAHLGLFPAKEVYPKAKWAAEKSLELDEALADAHVALGAVKLYYDWEFGAAEKEYKRAIELNPNNADAHLAYSAHLKAMGRYAEEIAEAKRAQELDPISLVSNMEVAEAFYMARRYDDAIAQAKKALELDPHFFLTHHVLARAYEQKGMYPEAISQYKEALGMFVHDPHLLASLGHIYAKAGQRGVAQKVLDELKQMSQQRYIPPYLMAKVYAGLGDKDQAFAWLEKAYEDRYFLMVWLRAEPQFDSLRSDPRFAALIRRIGLPE